MDPRFERGLSVAEAKRFYDRYGRKLDAGDRFEGRAKALAGEWVALAPGEQVVEVGVGCGHFLREAAAAVGPAGRVVGVDVSETMLALGREQAPRARLVRASVERLPLASASCDAAYCGYTLDLLPLAAIRGALAELRRVLRPDGRLVLCSLTEGEGPLERTLMWAWKRIWLLGPSRVGGCRPLVLGPLALEAGFRIERQEHVGQLGTPSEVLLLRPAG